MKKKNNLMWSISLFIISIATIILAASNLVGIKLSDIVVRIIGILDLIALPFLVYTTVKKLRKNQDEVNI